MKVLLMQETLNWLAQHTPIHIDTQSRLSERSTLKIGGRAPVLFHTDRNVLAQAIAHCHDTHCFYRVIGDASNVLFSSGDLNFPLITTAALQKWSIEQPRLYAEAGVSISLLAKETAKRGLKGLENFYKMPGSIGGAIYMNARCFDNEIASVLREVLYLDTNGDCKTYSVVDTDFSYKHSPFQDMPGTCIVACTLALEEADPQTLLTFSEQCFAYRKKRGHFDHPCAGSIFKNNRSFGAPTGALLDSLGMKELSVGGAFVSSQNANIIQNRNKAQFRDVIELMHLLEEITKHRTGHILEREIEVINVHR